MHDLSESDFTSAGMPARGSALIPLLALGLGGIALGRALRTTPLGRGAGGRGLVAVLAGLALLQQRRHRVGEIERMLDTMPSPGETPVTQSVVPVAPADTPMGEPGRNTEARLDEAVQETFPASDPIAVHIE